MQIKILNANYPNPSPNEVLAIRALTWLKHLGYMDDDIFIEAVNYHIDISEYFPTVKHIRDAYKYVIDHKPKPILLQRKSVVLTKEEEKERIKLISEFKKRVRKIGET